MPGARAVVPAAGPFLPYEVEDSTIRPFPETILPRQPTAYYHEYTVETPGSADRGARRIVTGRGGDQFYTDDHYASFREIVGG